MLIVDRKYWLLSIAAGLAVGLLAMLIMLPTVDKWFKQVTLLFVGPALFGAVFVYCLRSTVGTNWWRGLCLLLGIVAAHIGAFHLAWRSVRDLPDPFRFLGVISYGATFALVFAGLAALLFRPARSAWLVAITVLASGLVALSYWPLLEILPGGGWFFSPTAALVTFGLVYAVVAALLGWRLFENKTGANFKTRTMALGTEMSDDVNGIPKRALELENRAVWPNNEPTLFAAYQVLRDQWLNGHRNRECALHLAFLTWYIVVGIGTGYEEVQTDEGDIDLATLFSEARDWLDPARSADPEVVYVFHVICEVGTLFLDTDDRLWGEAQREQYRKRYLRMLPAGIDPNRFANRGYFGEYFAMQARREAEVDN